MRLEDLDRDEDLRRREFPVAANKIFLAHAGVCALPHRVAQAMRDYLDLAERGDQEHNYYHSRIRETRELAAKLVGCEIGEVALVGPTSVGLSLVANGLDWKPGDELVAYFDDYPSNVYPWMRLKEQGVEVRFVRAKRPGEVTLRAVEEEMSARTRLVALASVHFLSGYRVDLEGIGALCRSRGAHFCVDGIQSVGAVRTPLAGVDFLAADAHKWMLGPLAAGILFVRKEAQEKLKPTLVGWANVLSPGFVPLEKLQYTNDASRYEAGSQNLVGIVGMHAALEMLLAVGVERIEERLLANSHFLRAELAARGWELLGQEENPRRSGSVTFYGAGADLNGVFGRMTEKGIVASLRQDRAGNLYIRLSPHFYNTRAELERTLEAIGKR